MSASIKVARMRTQGGVMAQRRVMGGDPGLFGSIGRLVGGAIKTVGKVVSSVPGVGGVAGGVLGTVGGAIAGGGPKTIPAPRINLPTLIPTQTMPIPVTPSPGISGGIARLLPGGKSGYEVAVPMGVGQSPSGYHWNKSSYFLSDGTFVPEGSKLVKNRRRNAANPRALDRALGRVNSAKRLQHKLSKISTGKYTASGKRKGCPA